MYICVPGFAGFKLYTYALLCDCWAALPNILSLKQEIFKIRTLIFFGTLIGSLLHEEKIIDKLIHLHFCSALGGKKK